MEATLNTVKIISFLTLLIISFVICIKIFIISNKWLYKIKTIDKVRTEELEMELNIENESNTEEQSNSKVTNKNEVSSKKVSKNYNHIGYPKYQRTLLLTILITTFLLHIILLLVSLAFIDLIYSSCICLSMMVCFMIFKAVYEIDAVNTKEGPNY